MTDRLPAGEADYLARLVEQATQARTQAAKAQEHLQAFLDYLSHAHAIPVGSQVTPEGEILPPSDAPVPTPD